MWDETSLDGDVVLETTGGVNTGYTLARKRLISQTRSGSTSYYLQDGQGSTRTLTNSAGSVTDTYDYTAFGEIYSQSGKTENMYLYTGQQYDGASGLYSLRARYTSALGRLYSVDAILESSSTGKASQKLPDVFGKTSGSFEENIEKFSTPSRTLWHPGSFEFLAGVEAR